ncbi:MAG: hypothetical protein XD75_0362 [Parcubacteria bacterium 33_209]|nr:MAG: hypothetical protein XD75_0362 [Parcubacteria bacterium 33_209]
MALLQRAMKFLKKEINFLKHFFEKIRMTQLKEVDLIIDHFLNSQLINKKFAKILGIKTLLVFAFSLAVPYNKNKLKK